MNYDDRPQCQPEGRCGKGALWYHADYVSPYWRRHFAEGPTIGRHIFYSDRKAASAQPAQLASR